MKGAYLRVSALAKGAVPEPGAADRVLAGRLLGLPERHLLVENGRPLTWHDGVRVCRAPVPLDLQPPRVCQHAAAVVHGHAFRLANHGRPADEVGLRPGVEHGRSRRGGPRPPRGFPPGRLEGRVGHGLPPPLGLLFSSGGDGGARGRVLEDGVLLPGDDLGPVAAAALQAREGLARAQEVPRPPAPGVNLLQFGGHGLQLPQQNLTGLGHVPVVGVVPLESAPPLQHLGEYPPPELAQEVAEGVEEPCRGGGPLCSAGLAFVVRRAGARPDPFRGVERQSLAVVAVVVVVVVIVFLLLLVR